MPTAQATRATRSTTSPLQPASPWTAAKSTPAPHCWFSQGSPNAVKVNGSVRRTVIEASISSPDRTW